MAEHEYEIIPLLEKVMAPFKYSKKIVRRPGKKEMIHYVICSCMLARQLQRMGLKEKIPNELFANKELLRGFLIGMFDGDGTVDKIGGISLCFGKGHTYKKYAEDIQRALEVFGVRSRLSFCKDRINVNVLRRDRFLYLEKIGFLKESKNDRIINSKTNEKFVGDGKMGRTLHVKSIVKSKEYIEMYDVLNSDTGKFMCEGLIVHNSCADLMKIAMIRIYRNIDHKRAQFIMTVHDEISFYADEDYMEDAYNIVKFEMESALKTVVPLKADVALGRRWSDNK